MPDCCFSRDQGRTCCVQPDTGQGASTRAAPVAAASLCSAPTAPANSRGCSKDAGGAGVRPPSPGTGSQGHTGNHGATAGTVAEQPCTFQVWLLRLDMGLGDALQGLYEVLFDLTVRRPQISTAGI